MRVDQIPKTLNIMGREYEVKVETLDGEFGDCQPEKRMIRVDPDADPSTILFTLIHEAMHGIFAETGLHKIVSHRVQEVIITALENGLELSGLIKNE